jgi:hypothetical protein
VTMAWASRLRVGRGREEGKGGREEELVVAAAEMVVAAAEASSYDHVATCGAVALRPPAAAVPSGFSTCPCSARPLLRPLRSNSSRPHAPAPRLDSIRLPIRGELSCAIFHETPHFVIFVITSHSRRAWDTSHRALWCNASSTPTQAFFFTRLHTRPRQAPRTCRRVRRAQGGEGTGGSEGRKGRGPRHPPEAAAMLLRAALWALRQAGFQPAPPKKQALAQQLGQAPRTC